MALQPQTARRSAAVESANHTVIVTAKNFQETAGKGPAHLCDFFILEIEHPARQIAVRSVPESVDAEHLDIDTVFVHIRNAQRR